MVAVCGTLLLDRLGRRPLALYSALALTVFIFMVGALTKVYGDSVNTSGIYATVACIFLFQGAYSFGWTPLTMLYPPEILNYSIRSVGMGVYTFLSNGVGLMVAMSFPIALEKIGWKTYMINGVWDVLQVAFIYRYWIETSGKTLEEIDVLFDPSAVTATMVKIQDVIEGHEVVDAIETANIIVDKKLNVSA